MNARPVLLACIGEEMHSLALYALGAVLSERKIAVQFLGARTPIEAVSAVVKSSAPPAIFLWAQLDKNGKPEVLGEIPSIRPAPRIVLGGPGWKREEVKRRSSSMIYWRPARKLRGQLELKYPKR